MTLDELNKIDINDPNQVKALQNFLKSRGYYNGAIDGKWGGGTIDGVKSLRTDLRNDAEVRRDTAVAGAEAEKAKSSWGRFAQEFGPYGGGAAGGLLAGYGIMKSNAAQDKALGEEVRRMPANKKISPIAAEKTLDARMSARRWRTGKQLLNPAAAFGLAEVTRRYIKPNVSEQIQPYVDLSASAEQGVGGGLAFMAVKDALSSKNPVPADTEALIRSRAAEARGDPYTISGKAKAAAAEATSAADSARLAELRAKKVTELRAEAKAAGLHVSGTKEDLARRIAEAPAQTAKPKRAPKVKGGLLAPFAAGAIAYDAASSSAEAAGDTPMEARGKGALAGFGAAGMTAAVPYALSKLPESVGRAAAAGGPALTAGTIDAMTDYSPTEQLQGRVALGEYLPRWAQSASIREAHEMAQVPERNPARPRAGMFEEGSGQDFDAMLAEFVRAVEEHNAGVGSYGP